MPGERSTTTLLGRGYFVHVLRKGGVNNFFPEGIMGMVARTLYRKGGFNNFLAERLVTITLYRKCGFNNYLAEVAVAIFVQKLWFQELSHFWQKGGCYNFV